MPAYLAAEAPVRLFDLRIVPCDYHLEINGYLLGTASLLRFDGLERQVSAELLNAERSVRFGFHLEHEYVASTAKANGCSWNERTVFPAVAIPYPEALLRIDAECQGDNPSLWSVRFSPATAAAWTLHGAEHDSKVFFSPLAQSVMSLSDSNTGTGGNEILIWTRLFAAVSCRLLAVERARYKENG